MIVFLDSSTIFYGLEFDNSNPDIILKLLIDKEIQAYINEKVIAEFKSYFRTRKGRNYTYLIEVFLRRNCVVIKNSELIDQMEILKGKIKRKDLEHIATVKLKNLQWLVAYDEDFEGFTEYICPKEFVIKIGLKPRSTEYKINYLTSPPDRALLGFTHLNIKCYCFFHLSLLANPIVI